MRSLADQTVAELGGRWSILHRQKQDHGKLDGMLEQLSVTSGNQRKELLIRICRLVFTHAFAEEAVLWPELRRSLADGEELTARVEREHQDITELVAALEQADRKDPGKEMLIERTVVMLRKDVRDEEDLLLPRLQAALDPALVATSNRIGAAARRIEQLPPLRRGERPETRLPHKGSR